jgi:hypothetical protein
MGKRAKSVTLHGHFLNHIQTGSIPQLVAENSIPFTAENNEFADTYFHAPLCLTTAWFFNMTTIKLIHIPWW